MKNKRKIDICLTPSMLDFFELSNKQVIVIDVFRATSAMCVFLNNGGDYVVPIATIEDAKKYQNKTSDYNQKKYLVAAERNGAIVSGFEFGNSPLLYHGKKFHGLSLAITTTNGTNTIKKANSAGKGMLLASFLNISAVVNYIFSSDTNGDILIVCSGWKGRFCLEDALLAGLLSKKLLSMSNFETCSDSVLLATHLYSLGQYDLFDFLSKSSYRKRMNLDADVKYCLQQDIMAIVPVWSFKKNKISDQFGFFSIKQI